MVAQFQFADEPREGAGSAISKLQTSGFGLEILSGDREAPVAALAGKLGISRWTSRAKPGAKVGRLEELRQQGRRVLMVGDGLNDAPALAAAHVSMAPAGAADVGRQAADFVFLHENLDAVPVALTISKRAGKLIRQNFALAIAYNMIAVPLAVFGYASPLVAAVAMSSSSIIVVLNSMRLKRKSRETSLNAHAAAQTTDQSLSAVVTT